MLLKVCMTVACSKPAASCQAYVALSRKQRTGSSVQEAAYGRQSHQPGPAGWGSATHHSQVAVAGGAGGRWVVAPAQQSGVGVDDGQGIQGSVSIWA